MSCRLVSPYLPLGSPCAWLRGNHHGHSTRSDGAEDPLTNIRAYEAEGYDYFELSEHDDFADPIEYAAETDMVLLPAAEITSATGQTLMYLGATPDLPAARALSLLEIAAFVHEREGLFIVDHPNWRYRAERLHAEVEEILAAPEAQAIEIYTGVIERLPGSPAALDVWDRLLTDGRVCFGHAVDDQHAPVDRFLGWNRVQWPADEPVTAEGIIEALRTGRFYASTGVSISDVGVSSDGQHIIVRSDARLIRWIVRDGRLAHVTAGGEARVGLADLAEAPRMSRAQAKSSAPVAMAYVRAELVGDNGKRAWTQPFFIKAAADSSS